MLYKILYPQVTVLGENCQNIDAMKIAPNDDMQTARKKHGKLKIVWSSFGKGGKISDFLKDLTEKCSKSLKLENSFNNKKCLFYHLIIT